MDLAREVAENISADAQSGSAMWDEVGGPGAVMNEFAPGKFRITIPQWDDTGDIAPAVIITVEMSCHD